ncbi:MAG: PaaX family transcriptional regulator C-terminal domain-containing protein [Litoreibacter sp.]
MSNLEIAALRILIVHGWRRIVLRTPALPDFVFPDHWAGPACRDHVARLLTQLPAQDLAGLED